MASGKQWLEGEAGVRDADSEVAAGAFDGDRGVVIVDQSKHVNQFVVTGADGFAEEGPEPVGQEILFEDEAQPFGNAIIDDVVSVVCEGLKAIEQIVDQMMQ